MSNVSNILEYFGVRLDFLKYRQDFVKVFKIDPATQQFKLFKLYTGGQEFEAQFMRLFPADADKLKRFFACSGDLRP
jgi:hypothetical protein